MFTVPVPDYFQEDSEGALQSRMEWLDAEVGLDAPFFARLLRTDETTFTCWREVGTGLTRGQIGGLQDVWEMMMHILSFVNFDSGRARRLLEHISPAAPRRQAKGAEPPWAGSSIKAHLETNGRGAVDEVNLWITSFRFAAPSLTPESEVPCPSTPD
jgi:hypothetical protein